MKIIIKYRNRKLYDKNESKYVTLTEIVRYPLGSFKVVEHLSGKNVTEHTLLSSLLQCSREDAKNIMTYLLKEAT